MKRQHSELGSFALKLDMNKVNNGIDRVFLEKMMYQLGFHSSLIAKILKYLTLVFYMVILNSTSPRESFVSIFISHFH